MISHLEGVGEGEHGLADQHELLRVAAEHEDLMLQQQTGYCKVYQGNIKNF